MDHFQFIYRHRAADYHRLITPEDVDGNLLPALEQITPLRDKRILDLGTGTGRIPLLLNQPNNQVVGLDLHAAMLAENRYQRQQTGGQWALAQADMRTLPVPDHWAEVVIAGWSIGHLTGWYPQTWRSQIRRILQEMQRVMKPGGVLMIIETLTTGSLVPVPPSPLLAKYYTWLENKWGFTRQEISTDYQFASVEQAVAYTEFFFGQDLAAVIRQQGWSRLPEWTGVWSKVIVNDE